MAAKLTGDDLHIRYVALAQAKKWERNPKKHDYNSLTHSIVEHGFRDAPLYDGTLDAIVAGNGRTTALNEIHETLHGRPTKISASTANWIRGQLDGSPPKGVAQDGDGAWYLPMQFGIDALSVAAAESFGVAHNNLTMMGGEFSFEDVAKMWDADAYGDLLKNLQEQGALPIGISDADVESFAGGGDKSDGSLLALLDVTIAEPRHKVSTGETWRMGDFHVLVCMDVMTGWPDWINHLDGDAVLCPYPGPLIALTKKADDLPLVLVQPDPYIAGHCLDRYADVHGESAVVRD